MATKKIGSKVARAARTLGSKVVYPLAKLGAKVGVHAAGVVGNALLHHAAQSAIGALL